MVPQQSLGAFGGADTVTCGEGAHGGVCRGCPRECRGTCCTSTSVRSASLVGQFCSERCSVCNGWHWSSDGPAYVSIVALRWCEGRSPRGAHCQLRDKQSPIHTPHNAGHPICSGVTRIACTRSSCSGRQNPGHFLLQTTRPANNSSSRWQTRRTGSWEPSSNALGFAGQVRQDGLQWFSAAGCQLLSRGSSTHIHAHYMHSSASQGYIRL